MMHQLPWATPDGGKVGRVSGAPRCRPSISYDALGFSKGLKPTHAVGLLFSGEKKTGSGDDKKAGIGYMLEIGRVLDRLGVALVGTLP